MCALKTSLEKRCISLPSAQLNLEARKFSGNQLSSGKSNYLKLWYNFRGRSLFFLWLISAHVFFLKYFQEFELKLRFGKSYEHSKQKVPFLIPRMFINKFMSTCSPQPQAQVTRLAPEDARGA